MIWITERLTISIVLRWISRERRPFMEELERLKRLYVLTSMLFQLCMRKLGGFFFAFSSRVSVSVWACGIWLYTLGQLTEIKQLAGFVSSCEGAASRTSSVPFSSSPYLSLLVQFLSFFLLGGRRGGLWVTAGHLISLCLMTAGVWSSAETDAFWTSYPASFHFLLQTDRQTLAYEEY